MSTARLVIEVLRWSAAWWLLWRVPRPGDGAGPAPPAPAPGDVSVVIPARDEEANLARLLGSLAGEAVEVVVVDDHSTDATAELARRLGATVVAAGPLPEGWTGKAWACATGAAHAGGRRLAFLDADTVVEPGGLARILAEHDRHGGLVSVQPHHVPRRPYEQLSAFFNLVALMGVDAFTPLGRRRAPTGAFGPCLVIGRADYDAVGGHAGVRSQVLEDVALGRAAGRAGLPVTLFGGRGSLGFRMYPGGGRQLVEGWTKNIAGGAAGTRPLTLALVVAWLSGAVAAAASLVAAATGARGSPTAAAGLYLAYAGQVAVLLRRAGRFHPLTAVAFPVPLAFFLAVFARSLALTYLRREVVWRGRTIATGAGRPR